MQVSSKALYEAVARMSFAVLGRGIVPELRCIAVSALTDTLVLEAFDYETSVTVHIPTVGLSASRVLIDARELKSTLAGFGRKAADRLVVSFDGGNVTLEQSGRRAVLKPNTDAADYPALPLVAGKTVDLGTDTLATVVSNVLPAVGTDLILPVLTGVHLVGGSGQALTAEATNRFILTRWDGGPSLHDDIDLIVPGRVLEHALKLSPRASWSLTWNDGSVALSTGDGAVVVTTRVLEGSYPDPDRIIAGIREDDSFACRASDLAAAVKACPVSRNMPVHIDARCEGVRVWSDRDGSVSEATVFCQELHGDTHDLSFNPPYLLAALQYHGTATVRVSRTAGANAWKFTSDAWSVSVVMKLRSA